MRSVVEIGASVPAFLGKLWKLVNDSETNHLISWSPGGKTFVIKNQADFARELLPLYYKHNNMASFIRQLNMYGFHKITSVENGGLRYEKDEIEFSHPCFMRGHAYLLEHIKRKIANPKSIVASNESGEKILLKPELMNKVLADVKQMKGKQESLDAKFSAMKQENEALWREVAILRQKHIKQQQIVNNLIQFLMSLVQPTRAPNSSGNNVGVKRPYQLMINNAAHNSATEGYPGRLKNMKLDKDALLEELAEDNLEDGPTIHELAHDDILHSEASQDSLDPSRYVYVSVLDSENRTANKNTDPAQYHVTMEDGDDIETDRARLSFPINTTGFLRIPDTQPIVSSPSPTSASPLTNPIEQAVNSVVTSPGTSKPRTGSSPKTVPSPKILLSPSNYHIINPSADFKLPAEIFASDDSISDAGVNTAEELSGVNTLQDQLSGEQMTKDKMLGGINIKVENSGKRNFKVAKKAKKTKEQSPCPLNLADIKTELQDDLDWNNMSLATMNNNSNRLQAMNDIDDHLDTMQTDLESLRELLRSDSYSLDTNTLLGIEQSVRSTVSHHTKDNLFGSDDPFYGLSYNSSDERAKTNNAAKKLKGELSNVSSGEIRNQSPFDEDDAEGSQLISYTGNLPDFGDISIPELDAENSQEACQSPRPGSSMLNTPQVTLQSPSYPVRP
ncbi:heat shock factor protein isoform X3 [Bicyclus anynana]|uniref:Heat shock factor protein isoform X3 n=1 Tax=Bicyclus anynana TaxID=110368 RepID=A0A6J1NEE0_BICAN|nr:heat shock factor protein isoform X3 [Bicyclus anynana]